jgi:hypothetical protein
MLALISQSFAARERERERERNADYKRRVNIVSMSDL